MTCEMARIIRRTERAMWLHEQQELFRLVRTGEGLPSTGLHRRNAIGTGAGSAGPGSAETSKTMYTLHSGLSIIEASSFVASPSAGLWSLGYDFRDDHL